MEPNSKTEENKQVTPFKVQTTGQVVDYDKLVKEFGCSLISPELIQKFETTTGQKAHLLLRRGHFFTHRDFDVILDLYSQAKPFYIYTGRGPSSSSLHIGHIIPFMFTKYLQDVFDVPVVIQITDDEKFLYTPTMELDISRKSAIENIKDIIAVGFNPEKTFIFQDTEYIGSMYMNAIKVQKMLTLNQIQGIFGFSDSDNIGKYAFPAMQAVPSFSNTFPHIFGTNTKVPCLIPMGIDQDPYFRMTRDIAHRMKYMKPSCIHSKFIPALQGANGKMSASDPKSAIFLTDTSDEIKSKINKYAFSGGKDTAEEQKKFGANLDIDVSYQYLKFFMEDDANLLEIGEKYKKGEMLTGEIKAILIGIVQAFVMKHQKARAMVTDEVVKHFCSVRKIMPVSAKYKEMKEILEKAKTKAKLEGKQPCPQKEEHKD